MKKLLLALAAGLVLAAAARAAPATLPCGQQPEARNAIVLAFLKGR